MARTAARVDDNQADIVEYARALGFSVAHTHTLGGGFPDLVLGLNGVNFLVEVKDGNKPPSRRKLTDDEQEFVDGWRGTVDIVESVEDVAVLHGIAFSEGALA